MINNFSELSEIIGKLLPSSPLCVETGCMYTCGPGNEIHTTTNNILANICVPRNGFLYSFDLDREHIEFARNFCKGSSSFVAFVEGDSVENLSDWSSSPAFFRSSDYVDLLVLDSKEFDESHMVMEYLSVVPRLRPDKHIVLVDDIHNPNSVKYKKAVPLLKSSGYTWFEVSTPTGMFVAHKGYDSLHTECGLL